MIFRSIQHLPSSARKIPLPEGPQNKHSCFPCHCSLFAACGKAVTCAAQAASFLMKTMPTQDEGVSGELHPWSTHEEGGAYLRMVLVACWHMPIWEVLHIFGA